MNAQAVKTAKNIAVVGAGLAGLAAASRLVKGGAKVTIFEKSNQAGGRGGHGGAPGLLSQSRSPCRL